MMKNIYQKLITQLDAKREFSALFIRLLVGFHLIYGTQDNVFSYGRMLEFRDFLQHYGFPLPLISAFVSVYVQFIAGFCFLLGLFVRPAAVIIIANFIIAILMVHVGANYAETFPALVMLMGACFLLFNGPGKPALSLVENEIG